MNQLQILRQRISRIETENIKLKKVSEAAKKIVEKKMGSSYTDYYYIHEEDIQILIEAISKL